ncbi:unnamed protein product [Closterium sp. NIES-53]
MATLSLARSPADIAGASVVSADVSADLRLLAAHLPCGDVAVCALGSPVRPAAATTHVLFRDRADPAGADAPPHAPSYHRRIAWLCPRQQPGEPCDQGQSHDRILVLLRPRRVSLYAIRASASPLSGSPIAAASVQARLVSGSRAGVRVVFWPGGAHESSSARGANDALDLAGGAAGGAGDNGRWEQLAGGGEAAAHMSMGAGARMGFSMSAWHAHFDSAPWHSLLTACGAMAAGGNDREKAHSSGEASMQESGSEGGAWGCAVEQVVAVGVESDPHASHLALLLTSRQAYSHMCLSPSALRCQAPLPAHSSVLVLGVAGGASADNGWQGAQGDAGGMVGGLWRGVQGEQGRGAGAVVRVQCCIHLHAVTGAQHGAGAMWSAVKLQGAVLCAVQPCGAAFTWSAASGRPLHSLLLTPAGPTPLAPTHASAPPHALHLHGADACASSRSSESSHSYPPMDDTHCSLGVAAGGMGDVVGVVLGWQGALLCAVTTTGLVVTALLRAPPPFPAPLGPPMRSVVLCSPLASGRLLLGLVHADRPGLGEGSTAVLTVAVLHSPHTSHHSLPHAAPHPAADATCPPPKARVTFYSFPLAIPHNHAPITHTRLAPALPSLSLPSSALPLLSCHRLLCLSDDHLLLLLPAHLPSPLHLTSSAPLFPMCHLPRSCLPTPPPAAALRMTPTLAALQLEGVPSPTPCGGGEQREGEVRMLRGHFASVVVGGSGVVERWVGAERQEEAWVQSVSEAMGAVMAIEGDVMNREDLGGTAFLALLHHTAHANGWPDSCLVLQHVRLCLDLMCPAPSVVRLLFLLHGISAPLQVKAFHCLLSYLIAHLPLARFSRSHARYTSSPHHCNPVLCSSLTCLSLVLVPPSLLAHAIRALLQALLLHYHTAPASPHRARRPHSTLRPRTPAGRHAGVGRSEKGRGGGQRRQQEGEAGSEEQAVQRASMEALSDVLLTLRRLHTAATRLAAHHAAPSAATTAPSSAAGGAAESGGAVAGGGEGGTERQSGMLLLSAPHALAAAHGPQAVLPSGPLYSRLPLPHLPPSVLMPRSPHDNLSVPSSLFSSQPPHQPTTLTTRSAQPLALPPPPTAAPAMDILPHQLPVLPPHSAPMRAWMEGGQQESVRAMLQRWQQQQIPSQVVVCDAIASCRLPLATAFLHHRLLHPSRTRSQQPCLEGADGGQHKTAEEEEGDTEAREEGRAEADADGREAGREEAGRAGREEAEHVVQVEGRRLALAFLWQGHAGMAAQVLLRLGAHVHASLLDLLLRSFSSHLRHVLSHYLHHHHLLPPPLLHSLASTQAIQDMYPLRSFTSAYRLRCACAPASLQPRPATCAAPSAPPGTAPDSSREEGSAAMGSGGAGEACHAVGQGVAVAGGEGGVDERGADGGAGRRVEVGVGGVECGECGGGVTGGSWGSLVALVPAQGGQGEREGVEAWGEGAGGGEKEKMEAEGVGDEEQSGVKAGDGLSVVVRHGFACVATAWVQHWDSALLLQVSMPHPPPCTTRTRSAQVLAEGALLASSPTPSLSFSSCSPTFSSSDFSSPLMALHHMLATHRLHIPPSLPTSPPPSPASLVAWEALLSLSLRHHLPAFLSPTLHALPPTALARSPITAALHRPPHYSLTTSTAPTRPCMRVPVVLAAAVLEPTTALLRAECAKADGAGGSADGRGSSGFMRRALEEQLAAQGVLLAAHWRHPFPLLRLLARAHMLLPPKSHLGELAGGGGKEAGGVDGVSAGRRGLVGEGEGDEGRGGDGEADVRGGEGGAVAGLQWSAVGMTVTCSALRLPLLLHLFLDTHSASHYTRMQHDTLEDDMVSCLLHAFLNVIRNALLSAHPCYIWLLHSLRPPPPSLPTTALQATPAAATGAPAAAVQAAQGVRCNLAWLLAHPPGGTAWPWVSVAQGGEATGAWGGEEGGEKGSEGRGVGMSGGDDGGRGSDEGERRRGRPGAGDVALWAGHYLSGVVGCRWVKGARQERVGGADVDAWGDDELWWWQEGQWCAEEWCTRGSRADTSGDEAHGDRDMGEEEAQEEERGEGEAEEQGEEGNEEEMVGDSGSGGGSRHGDAHGRSAGATQVQGRRAGLEVRRAAGGRWEEVPVSAVEQWQQHLWRSLLLALLLHPPSHPALPSHLPLLVCLDRLLGRGRMAAQGDRGRGWGEGRGKEEERSGEWWQSGMGRREEVVAVLGGGRGMWQMRGVRTALTASQHPAQGISLPCLVPPALLSPSDALHHHLHAISHHTTPLPPTPALALALRLHLLLFTPVPPNPLASCSLPPATFPWELPPSFPLPCALQLAPHAALQRLPSLAALSHSLASTAARPHACAWLSDPSPMATLSAPQAPTSAHPSALLPLPHALRHQLLAASPLALFLSLLPSLLSPSVTRASLKATTHHLHGLASAAALLARTHTPLLASASTFLSLLGLSSSRLRLVIAALHLVLSSSPPPSPSSLAAVAHFLHCYCSAWGGGQQGGAGRAGEAAQHKAARQLLRLLEVAVLGEAEAAGGKGEGENGAGGICVVEVGAVEKGWVGKGVVQGWSNHAVEMVGEEEQQERQRRVQQAMQRREQQQQQRDEWALVLALAAEFSLPPPNTLLLRFARANDWVWLHGGASCVCAVWHDSLLPTPNSLSSVFVFLFQMGLLAQAQAQTWPLHDLLHIVHQHVPHLPLRHHLSLALARCATPSCSPPSLLPYHRTPTLFHVLSQATTAPTHSHTPGSTAAGPPGRVAVQLLRMARHLHWPLLAVVAAGVQGVAEDRQAGPTSGITLFHLACLDCWLHATCAELLAASTHSGSHGLAAAGGVMSAQGEVERLGRLGDGGEEEGEAEEGVEEACGGGVGGKQWVLGLRQGKRRRVEAERGWKGERQAAGMVEGEQRVPHSQAQPGTEATQVEGQERRQGGEEARGMGLGGMVAWLCREGCVLPLLRGLHLFLPRCSLLYLLLALQAHWRQHREEAEACVAEFNVLADREHAHAQAPHHHQGHALGEALGDLEDVWGAEGAAEEEQAANHDLPPLHTLSSFFSPSFSLRSLALRCSLSPSAILSSLASLAVDAAIARAASPHQTLSLLHLLSRARLPPPAQHRLQQLQVETQLLSGDPSGSSASPLPSVPPVAARGNTSSAAGARVDGGAEQSWAEGGRGWGAATEPGEGGMAERADSDEAGWGNEALQQLVQAGRWNEARALAGRLEGHGGSTAREGGTRMADGGGDSLVGRGWMGERVEQAGGGDEEGDEMGEGSTGAASMTQEASALQARITLTQAECMVREWQQLLWEEEEERAMVWEHCHHLFMRHRLPPHRAVAFFLAHACSLGTQLSRPTATPAAVPASDSDAEGIGGSREDGVGAVEGSGDEEEEERVEAETDPLSEGLWSAVGVWGGEDEGQEEEEDEEVWSEAGEQGDGWSNDMECAQRRARCLHPVLLLALQWNLRAYHLAYLHACRSAAALHTAPEDCTTPHATTTECELSLSALACRVWEVAALADHPLPLPLHCMPFPGLAVPLCSLWQRLARGPVSSFLARTARVMAANQDALCAAAAAPLDSPSSPSSCTTQLPLPGVWPSTEGDAGRGEDEERAREGVVQVLLERGQMEGARAVCAHVDGGGGRDGMMEADVAMVEAAEAIAVHEGMMDEDMHAMVLHACRTCPVEDDTRHQLFSDQPLDVLTALARLASLPSSRLCILRCFARRQAMQLLSNLSEPLCTVSVPALLRALLAEGEAAVASVQLLLATGVLSGADAVPAVAERIVQVIDSGYSSAASTAWRSASYRRFTDVRGRGHGDGEAGQGVGGGSTVARGAARQGSANVARTAFMSPSHPAAPPPSSSAASPRSFHPSPLLARASSLSSSAAASGRGLGRTASGKALWGGDAPGALDATSRLPWDESEVVALLSLLSHHPALPDLPFALPPLPTASPSAHNSSSRGKSSEAPPLIFLPLALLHCLKHLDGANASTQVDVLLLAHYASVAVPLAANETLPHVTEAMVQCAVSLASPSLASASLRLLLATTNPRPLCFILTRLLASGQLAFLLSRLPAAASAAHAVRSVFLQATLPATSASNPMSTMLSLSALAPPPSTATTMCATCARGFCPVPTAVPHASGWGSGVGGGRCSGGGGCLALEVRIAVHTAAWSQGLCDDSKNLVLQQLGPARELAEAQERRAGDYLADWRALQSSRWLHANDDAAVLMLLDAMRCLCAAASMWDGLGAGDRARRSVAQAALLGLQVHVGDTLVGLTPAAASVLLQQQHRFFEALVIANAYDLTSPADWSLLLWTHLDRFRPSPEFLDEWAMAVPMALDMLLDVAERVQHEVGNNRSAHVNYLTGAFRHLLWLVPNLEERLQLATVSRAAPAEVDKCLSMLDRVPATSAPLLLRRGHGGAYMPVL